MLDVINKHLKQSFSSDPDHVETFGNVLVRQTVFLSCVVVIALILKPDLFGLIPNSLDPMFYTGYAINLDDALAAAGNRHYFVTRWSSYMPQYVACQIFGAYWGRIALRLIMLAILSEVFWRIGKRFKFSAHARIIASLLVFMMPMFVRAFTTDYQEYSSTFYGILLVSIACTQSFTWKWATLFGVLTSLMLVSNPFNFFLIGFSGFIWFMFNFGDSKLKVSAVSLMSFGAGAICTLYAGYALFRYHYNIGNVYSPTIRFIRTYKAPEKDLWTAPGRAWLGHFGWLAIPVVITSLSLNVLKSSTGSSRRTVKMIQIITISVFLYHVYMQISKGHALETSYYWAMALAPVYVLTFLLLGTLLSRNKKITASLIPIVLTLSLIRFEIPNKLQLGAGYSLYFAIIVFLLFALGALNRRRVFATVLIVAGVLWLQIGAPSYTTRTYGGDLNSPRYDLVYGKNAMISNQVLHETIWFTEQMDQVSDDWKSSFMSAGGWSAAIIGTYIPHPFSRWILPASADLPLSEIVKDEMEFGSRKYLTIFGDPNEVASLLPRVMKQLPRAEILLNTAHRAGLGYRLVILEGNKGEFGSATILPSKLDRNIGKIFPDGSIEIEKGSSIGYATFGPYLSLTSGEYRAKLDFESIEHGQIGRFEMFSDVRESAISKSIVSDGSQNQSTIVSFIVKPSDQTWQFRTEYNGSLGMRLNKITLERLRKA